MRLSGILLAGIVLVGCHSVAAGGTVPQSSPRPEISAPGGMEYAANRSVAMTLTFDGQPQAFGSDGSAAIIWDKSEGVYRFYLSNQRQRPLSVQSTATPPPPNTDMVDVEAELPTVAPAQTTGRVAYRSYDAQTRRQDVIVDSQAQIRLTALRLAAPPSDWIAYPWLIGRGQVTGSDSATGKTYVIDFELIDD